MPRVARLMCQIAATDRTFEREGDRWYGKCLICNGRLSFDARTGFGANIEHIWPRNLGGGNALLNLGLTHPGCNAEKGRNWDPRRKAPRRPGPLPATGREPAAQAPRTLARTGAGVRVVGRSGDQAAP